MPERAGFVGRLTARRDHYRSARCRYWVFEDSAREGAFIEFIEAADAATLRTALAGAPDPVTEVRVYYELELD